MPNNQTCGHSYTTTSRRLIFTCQEKPHPSRPDQHYFTRDLVAEARRDNEETQRGGRLRRASRLVTTPGER